MKFTVPVGIRHCRFPTEIIARNPVSDPPLNKTQETGFFTEKYRTRQKNIGHGSAVSLQK